MNKNNGGRGRPAQITKEQAIQLEKRRIAEIKRRKERKAAFDKVVAVLVFALTSACIILAIIFAYIFFNFRTVDKAPGEPVKITTSDEKTAVLDKEFFAHKSGEYFVSLTKISEICGFTLHGNSERMTLTVNGGHASFDIGTRAVKTGSTYSLLSKPSYFENGNLFIPTSFFENFCDGIKCEYDKLGKVNGFNLIFSSSFGFKAAASSESEAVSVTPELQETNGKKPMFKADLSEYEMYMNPENKDDFLLLVNSAHPLKETFVPNDLIEVSYSKEGLAKESLRLYPAKALEAMFIEMKANGIGGVTVNCGYTSYEYQKEAFDNKVASLSGKYGSEAEKIAAETVAVPGTSEHQSGLCVDMHNLEYNSEAFATEAAYKWLYSNCADFGFILRYPKDKTAITGMAFEPWHFRYVGRYHAKQIMDSGVCLEEYLNS